LGLTAQPVETVRRSGRRADAEAVAKIARQKDARRIVVGLPLRTDGGEGPEAAEARRMAEAVAALLPGIELHMQDERFTTAQAERMLVAADVRRQKRREVVDTVAAVLILQGWLDSQGR
jgi:putative Holliday junction resolvase